MLHAKGVRIQSNVFVQGSRGQLRFPYPSNWINLVMSFLQCLGRFLGIIGQTLVFPSPTGYKLRWSMNGRGEPSASYEWTGWVWEITGWSSRLHEVLGIIVQTLAFPSPTGYKLRWSMNEWGELTASCGWTSWVWGITSWSRRIEDNYQSF